jgi:hypothetical protein
VAQPTLRTRAGRLEIARVRRRIVVAIVVFAIVATAAALWLLGLAGARPAVGYQSEARHAPAVIDAGVSGGLPRHG